MLSVLNSDVFEVLAAEDNDATLSHEQRKLVFLHIGQLGELEAFDFGSNTRSQFCDLKLGVMWVEEMRFGFVRLSPTVNELKCLSRRELGRLILDGKVSVVFLLFHF